MTANWNFREILGVDPFSTRFHCVGKRTTTRYDRCKGDDCEKWMFAHDNRKRASDLLDIMDRCESLKGPVQYLEELATMTLCPKVHDGTGKNPKLSQVDDTTRRWEEKITQYEKRLASEAYQKLRKKEMIFRDEGEQLERPQVCPQSFNILPSC